MNFFLLLALILSPSIAFAASKGKARTTHEIKRIKKIKEEAVVPTEAQPAPAPAPAKEEVVAPVAPAEVATAEAAPVAPAEAVAPAVAPEVPPYPKTPEEAKSMKGLPDLDPTAIGREDAILTDAPNVPPIITRTNHANVTVNLEMKEHVLEISNGVSYNVWTFGGKVPGKFIRVKLGDFVRFYLHNHQNNKVGHNIDLHAVTGQGGGAGASSVLPGYTSLFSFKATHPGLYVYHCATLPVPMHIANGMYGLILVQPDDNFGKVDKEYYVMQSEFYTKQKVSKKGLKSFSHRKTVMEHPTYVVFNGHSNSLTPPNKRLTATTGERVRLYLGNGGPNLISSFHVIGEIFDFVFPEGNTTVYARNVQTTAILPGGSAIVQFTVDVPGVYVLVDHSISRAFNKGALGLLEVKAKAGVDLNSFEVIHSGKLLQDNRPYVGKN